MSLPLLHQAFLKFFKAFVPGDPRFTKPYLSLNGKELRYPYPIPTDVEITIDDYGVERKYYYFQPLHDALQTVYSKIDNAKSLATPSQDNLLLLMRFCESLIVSTTYKGERPVMRAPIYCINFPNLAPSLHDIQELIIFSERLPNHPRTVHIKKVENLIRAEYIFQAIQALASDINTICNNETTIDTLDIFVKNTFQNQLFYFSLKELQSMEGLPTIQEQVALWEGLFKFNAARSLRAILTDNHVMWQMFGFALSLLFNHFESMLDPNFPITFNFIWQALGLMLFLPDVVDPMYIVTAFVGIIALSTFVEAFVSTLDRGNYVSSIRPNVTPLTSQICTRNFTSATALDICGRILLGLQVTLNKHDLLIASPVLTWFTKRPLLFTPAITDREIKAVEKKINTLTAAHRFQ